VCVFLDGMDEDHYGCVKTESNNDFVASNDNYLTSIASIMHMVTNWQDHKDGLFKSSFVQKQAN
jgi:hypothetical protein